MEYDKRNGNIVFAEGPHKYWDLTNPSAKFISVTTLIEKYGQPFNKEFWSMYKALETFVPKEDWKSFSKPLRESMKIPEETFSMYDFTKEQVIAKQQEILDEWQKKNQESCIRGTAIHAELENSFYKQGKNCTLKQFGIGGKFICDKGRTTLDLEDGVYPEYLISRVSDDGLLRIAGQIDLLVKKGNNYTVVDHKGLPLDTPILTNNGFIKMKDLKVGDIVFDKEGNPCNITVKSKIHYNPCYKITFDNSESIISDIDHRWLVSFYKQGKDKGYYSRVMTTQELKIHLDNITKRTSYNIPKIFNTKPIKFKTKDLPLDPYILGIWLGDGSKDAGVITQAKGSKLWDEIKNRGFELSDNLIHSIDRENVESRTVYGLRTKLKQIGVFNNKHIPEEYITASYEQRLDLLMGLMDTDGSYNKKRHRFVMNTSQKWQVYDLNKLLSTLGIKCTIFDVINKCDGKEFPGWNLCFTTNDFYPFLIRDVKIESVLKDNNSFRNIIKIEQVDTVPTQCIAVDSESHTYLAGYSCIVTHNTNSSIDKHSYFDSKTKGRTMMKYPLNHIEDSNYWHYTLQLSTYAWMIQMMDPNAKIDRLILNWYPHEGGNQLFELDYLKKDVTRMLAYYKKQLIHEQNELKYKEIEY